MISVVAITVAWILLALPMGNYMIYQYSLNNSSSLSSHDDIAFGSVFFLLMMIMSPIIMIMYTVFFTGQAIFSQLERGCLEWWLTLRLVAMALVNFAYVVAFVFLLFSGMETLLEPLYLAGIFFASVLITMANIALYYICQRRLVDKASRCANI